METRSFFNNIFFEDDHKGLEFYSENDSSSISSENMKDSTSSENNVRKIRGFSNVQINENNFKLQKNKPLVKFDTNSNVSLNNDILKEYINAKSPRNFLIQDDDDSPLLENFEINPKIFKVLPNKIELINNLSDEQIVFVNKDEDTTEQIGNSGNVNTATEINQDPSSNSLTKTENNKINILESFDDIFKFVDKNNNPDDDLNNFGAKFLYTERMLGPICLWFEQKEIQINNSNEKKKVWKLINDIEDKILTHRYYFEQKSKEEYEQDFNFKIKQLDFEFYNHVNYKVLGCETELYIMSYFGSETPTSDLDYTITKLEYNDNFYFHDGVRNIIQANDLITHTAKVIKTYTNTQKLSLQKKFDVNGYPDFMVVYEKNFEGFTLNDLNIKKNIILNENNIQKFNVKQDPDLDAIFLNVYTAQLYRICFAPHAHFFFVFGFNKNTFENEYKELKKNFYKCTEVILENFKGGFAYIRELELSDKIKFDISTLFTSLLDRFASLRVEAKTKIKENIESIEYLLALNDILGDNERFIYSNLINDPNKQILERGDISFNIHYKIIFESKQLSIEKGEYENFYGKDHFLMALVGASNSNAAESYSSIGALEYVKNFKNFINGKEFINCTSLIESLYDNISMALLHVIESHLGDEDLVKEDREISAALAKYFVSTIIIIKKFLELLKCITDSLIWQIGIVGYKKNR